MGLPLEICFRSSETIARIDESDNEGYRVQYQIENTIINVVIPETDDYDTGPQTVEGEWLKKLDDVTTAMDNNESVSFEDMRSMDEVSDQIEEWIETVCESTLCEILASMTTNTSSEATDATIHACLNSTIINLEIKTVDGNLTIIRHEGVPPWPKSLHLGQPFGLPVQLPTKAKVPTFDSSEVVIVEDLSVMRVRVNGEVFRCKLNHFEKSALRECEVYRKLLTVEVCGLKVPALKGYVKHEDKSGIVALLLEDVAVGKFATLNTTMRQISYGERSLEPPCASPTIQPELPSIERRRKWAHQIRETVKVLHENDIVWGDVKPANIVIDTNDDAWVLDFGGGFTPPWKYEADAGNMLGDLKALNLIEQYLETGETPPPRQKTSNVGSGNDNMVAETDCSQRDLGQSLVEIAGETQARCGKRKHPCCSPATSDKSSA